ncbi:hypothetical protein CWS72_07105 [Telmatospirillum siberiense]|uniref:Uncharacterized protein n=1 Tax=Telmatospirillum siberiense TaxID=382514 RepID=A0A2N3PY74_9PROT|nr:hypothetical protein CWS72_07105 [Telmatospirillum siberiense]
MRAQLSGKAALESFQMTMGGGPAKGVEHRSEDSDDRLNGLPILARHGGGISGYQTGRTGD